MELIDYISADKITVNNQQTIAETLTFCRDSNYSHIPIVVDKKWIGNLAKEDLLTISNSSTQIKELEYMYESFFAKESDSLLELFSNFAINNTNILPFLDKEYNYIGYLDLIDLLECFANTSFLSTEGNILLLEKSTVAYSMSEICQIVESNANTVLGCYLFNQDAKTTQITLKVKSLNINQLIQSFRRYDYTILNILSEDSYLEDLKKRSEYFIKYLNI